MRARELRRCAARDHGDARRTLQPSIFAAFGLRLVAVHLCRRRDRHGLDQDRADPLPPRREGRPQPHRLRPLRGLRRPARRDGHRLRVDQPTIPRPLLQRRIVAQSLLGEC